MTVISAQLISIFCFLLPVIAVSGPLCRDLEGLILIMKAQLVPLMHELDPAVPPIPFNNEVCFAWKAGFFKRQSMGFYLFCFSLFFGVFVVAFSH